MSSFVENKEIRELVKKIFFVENAYLLLQYKLSQNIFLQFFQKVYFRFQKSFQHFLWYRIFLLHKTISIPTWFLDISENLLCENIKFSICKKKCYAFF